MKALLFMQMLIKSHGLLTIFCATLALTVLPIAPFKFCDLHQNNAIITFENQGKRIPAERLHTIFEKFFRLDRARSSQTGGAGLGLAITKEIIELHHGSISASSDDHSTRFTIVLPLES